MRNKLGTSILLLYLFNPEIFHKRVNNQNLVYGKFLDGYIYISSNPESIYYSIYIIVYIYYIYILYIL